jgi:hypothetical protein
MSGTFICYNPVQQFQTNFFNLLAINVKIKGFFWLEDVKGVPGRARAW